MAIPLTINGATFEYPENFDENWGINATGWAQAVTNGMLQMSGGSFPITADINFGPNFGLLSKYFETRSSNPATTGTVRLSSADAGIVFRNNANTGNLVITTDGSDNLLFNGTPIGTSGTLTTNHIYVGNGSNVPTDVPMSGDATIVASGALTIANGAITNVKVNATAAIAVSKLAALTASRAVVSDGSGFISAATTTATEIGYVNGVTSSIQTQINNIQQVPSGAMLDFGGTVAPTGWLLCDGSVVAQATYPNLFTAIGSNWNTGGEGAGNFRLPDMTRRVGMGSGGSGTATIGNAVGNVGGEETHTLVSSEVPNTSVTVVVTDPGHVHIQTAIQAGGGTTDTNEFRTDASSLNQSGNTVSATTGITAAGTVNGSNGAHNNVQPAAIVLKIIKI